MRLLTSLSARTRAGLFLVTGSLLLAFAPVAAQQGSGTIKGTVTQSGNGQPLAGVIVTVTGTTIKAATNTRGAYTIDLTFSTEVTRPPAGTKLPADGGEQGKAFKALQTAMANPARAEFRSAMAYQRFAP